MFEEIMIEVHKQWLSEFDVEAARRRRPPRYRDHEAHVRHGFFRRRRDTAAAPAALCSEA